MSFIQHAYASTWNYIYRCTSVDTLMLCKKNCWDRQVRNSITNRSCTLYISLLKYRRLTGLLHWWSKTESANRLWAPSSLNPQTESLARQQLYNIFYNRSRWLFQVSLKIFETPYCQPLSTLQCLLVQIAGTNHLQMVTHQVEINLWPIIHLSITLLSTTQHCFNLY